MSEFTDHGFVIVDGIGPVGSGLVLGAASRGAEVVFSYTPGQERAVQAVLDAGRAIGLAERITAVAADPWSEADVEELFDTAMNGLPGLHTIIVNLAPMEPASWPLHETSLEEWNSLLLKQLRARFLWSRRAVGEFLGQGEGGRLIHVVYQPEDARDALSGYAVIRSGLLALIRSIAKEYGKRGVYCNGVAVDGANRAFGADCGANDNGLRESQQWIDAVCEAVLFLASERANFVDGEVLYTSAWPGK